MMMYLYILLIYIIFHFVHEASHYHAYKAMGCDSKYVWIKQPIIKLPTPVVDCPDKQFDKLTSLQKLIGFSAPLVTTTLLCILIWFINPWLGNLTAWMVFGGSIFPIKLKVHNPITDKVEEGKSDGWWIFEILGKRWGLLK